MNSFGKVLITGSNGFLGKLLTEKLKKNNFNVYEANSDNANLLDINQLFYLFSEIKFDYIFHLAVKTAAGGYCQTHPGEQFLINQLMNTNILRYWYEEQKQAKFITFGSSCGYDDNIQKVEINYKKGGVETDYEVYGMVKRMLLIGLEALNKEFNMKYIYFIPSTIYGENYELTDKHFIFDLIRKICDAKYTNIEPVVLWGDGEQRRELIYIHDAINIIINNSMSGNKINELMNLSTGKDYSIKEYAQMICNIVDYDFNKIKFDTSQFVGAKVKQIENTKNVDYKFTNIKKGLANTIKYYKRKKYGI